MATGACEYLSHQEQLLLDAFATFSLLGLAGLCVCCFCPSPFALSGKRGPLRSIKEARRRPDDTGTRLIPQHQAAAALVDDGLEDEVDSDDGDEVDGDEVDCDDGDYLGDEANILETAVTRI